MDDTQKLDLTAAVADMASTLMGAEISGLMCQEAESIAAVLAVAGHMPAAGHVLMVHADHDDEPGDTHHDVYAALIAPGGGFSHSETDEPFRLAMDHARGFLRAAVAS